MNSEAVYIATECLVEEQTSTEGLVVAVATEVIENSSPPLAPVVVIHVGDPARVCYLSERAYELESLLKELEKEVERETEVEVSRVRRSQGWLLPWEIAKIRQAVKETKSTDYDVLQTELEEIRSEIKMHERQNSSTRDRNGNNLRNARFGRAFISDYNRSILSENLSPRSTRQTAARRERVARTGPIISRSVPQPQRNGEDLQRRERRRARPNRHTATSAALNTTNTRSQPLPQQPIVHRQRQGRQKPRPKNRTLRNLHY